MSPTRSCTLVTHQGQSWCVATTAGVNAGTYPAGTRVMLREVHVEAIAGTLVTVSCQAPYLCDATAPGGTLNVDFAGPADIPPLWHWVDLYGTTGASGVLQPAGFVDRTYEGA